MSAAAERRAVGFSWVCYPDFVHCPDEHLLLDYPSGFRVSRRHLNGPALMVCRACATPTYFLAIYKSGASGYVSCHLITKDQHDALDAQETFPEIPELLHRLTDPAGHSHNPYWRPPRPREKR